MRLTLIEFFVISMPVTDAPNRAILSDSNPPPHPISKHFILLNIFDLLDPEYLDKTLLIYFILMSVNLCKD